MIDIVPVPFGWVFGMNGSTPEVIDGPYVSIVVESPALMVNEAMPLTMYCGLPVRSVVAPGTCPESNVKSTP